MKTSKIAFSALLFVALTLAGCKNICPVVNVAADGAKQACPLVIEYIDESGKTQKVTVPADEVRDLAAVEAVKAGKPLPKK